jgi:serine phosphatase RsbU (regulator of sigma subunit)
MDASACRVLVVDDSDLTRQLIADMLEDLGCDVEQARSGAEALAVIERNNTEVVVCDLHMTDDSGYDVLHGLRGEHKPPVVILSSDDDVSAVLTSVRAGAFDYVLKSQGMPNLVAAVDRAAHHHRVLIENRRLGTALHAKSEQLAERLRELDSKNSQLEQEILERKAAQRALAAQQELEKKQAVLEKDMALTAAVQQYFLPATITHRTERIAVAGVYRPAQECGGDWWWFEAVSDDRGVILIGDVTGHGAASAMVTASLATAYRVGRRLVATRPVAEVLEDLNRTLIEITRGDYLMTFATLELDAEAGVARWHNAGAPPLVAIRPSGEVRTVVRAGTPLGSGPLHIGSAELLVEPDDLLLLITDGVAELAVPGGRVLKQRQLQELAAACAGMEPDEAAVALLAALDKAREATPQNDDITFVFASLNAAPKTAAEAPA